MTTTSPFHAGERTIQRRLGVRESIEPWARKVVRSFLPEEHRAFYAQLPFLVLAARDDRGRPWATILAGAPGFAQSPGPRRMVLESRPVPGDALERGLLAGADVGILGIETATRRRNRINGVVEARSESSISLEVGQAFGNCPQYIHVREVEPRPGTANPVRSEYGDLAAPLREMIERADTFFIATGYRGDFESETFGMDASHRGGPPGFVSIVGDRELAFDDYPGNNHFNTLGNLELDPAAGLLFVDFERGDILQLTGQARVVWKEGGDRSLHFELDRAIHLRGALPIRWRSPEDAQRRLRVADKRRESDDVTSFYLEPAGADEALPEFAAGQHLPIEVEVEGTRHSRSYSLSAPLEDGRYRISVKREAMGVVSRFLHDELRVGDSLRAGRPSGDFVLEPTRRPIVLVSAGVGVTPMIAMLRALAEEGEGAGDVLPPVLFVHGARDDRHHALAEEARRAAMRHPGISIHVAYSRPLGPAARAGSADSEGRVDAALIERLLPDLDADFYLCGPQGFLTDVIDGLSARGVDEGRIRWEHFSSAVASEASEGSEKR